MYSNDQVTTTPVQITFHYLNGQSESFSILPPGSDGEPTTRQDIRQEMRRFLKEDWWVIQLMDETVFIKASNVLKVELKPPVASLEGEGILSHAQRVTALNRIR